MIVRVASRGGANSTEAGSRPLSAVVHEIGDRRMPDGLDVVASDRRRINPQHVAGGVVHELQAAGLAHDDDAFDHARENGRHAAG